MAKFTVFTLSHADRIGCDELQLPIIEVEDDRAEIRVGKCVLTRRVLRDFAALCNEAADHMEQDNG